MESVGEDSVDMKGINQRTLRRNSPTPNYKTKSGKFSIEEDRGILEYVLRRHPDIIEGEEENKKKIYVIQPIQTRNIASQV